MIKKEKENIYFVGLEEPSRLRKSLLESTRDVVDILKKFEGFKSIRNQKTNEIEKLKSDLREISKLIVKLKSELPKTKISAKVHGDTKLFKRKQVAEKEGGKEIVKKVEMTELDKLDAELSAIENKLKSLG